MSAPQKDASAHCAATMACPICRTTRAPNTLGKATLGDETAFDLVECEHCTARYLSPVPTDQQLRGFYKPQYYGSDWYKQRGWGEAFAHLYLARRKPGNFLDVGCGLGFYIAGIRARSKWKVFGVELTAPAVSYAREKLGLEVRQGELVNVHYDDAFFDYIHVNNVLEHVRDPLSLLKECQRILKPGGILHLVVPNGLVDSRDLVKYYHDRHIPPFSKSGHIYFFPKTALYRMFDEAGLLIQEARTFGLRRGLATLGLWPRFKDWRRHYFRRPFSDTGADAIALPPEKARPHLYYLYRLVRMKARMLPGLHDFGLDFEIILTRKE